jgi:hypothetical protein
MCALGARLELYLRIAAADAASGSIELRQIDPVARVIDIKATRAATAFHKTQVAFYARMLETLLNELGVPHRLDVGL